MGVVFGRYDDLDAARVAEEAVSLQGFNPVRLPVTLNIGCLNDLRRCDWVIVDITDPAIEAMTAFLYGQFVPVMRTRRQTDQSPGVGPRRRPFRRPHRGLSQRRDPLVHRA